MIVDASVVVDALMDHGTSGADARNALKAQPRQAHLRAPGLLAVEVLSALNAAASRPGIMFTSTDIPQALRDAEAFGITIEETPWADVHRAWVLSHHSLRYTDAIYVAAAERLDVPLLTSDQRIARSGAPLTCAITTL